MNATKAHDVFALGITLVTMLTGCAPWDAALATDARYRAFWSDDAFTQAPWCALSEPLLHLLRRMLAPVEARCTIVDVKACLSIPMLRMDAFAAPRPQYVPMPPLVPMGVTQTGLLMS